MYHWWHYRYQELCTTNYSFSPSNLMEWLQSYPLISSIECQILSYNLENILSDLLKHKFIDPEYFQVVSTSTGIKVFWDGSHRVEIKIPESLQSKVCGLCGDFNKVRNDDWRIGNSCPEEGRLGEIVSSQSNSEMNYMHEYLHLETMLLFIPSFSFQATNYNDFGHSWAVSGMCPLDQCGAPPPEACTVQEKQAALQFCINILTTRFGVSCINKFRF